MSAQRCRRFAVGGVAGPVGFVTAWLISGARMSAYSPVHDAISRLAAVHASTRVTMTAGFVVFAAGVAPFAVALRSALGGAAWVAALACSVCTLAVATFPLDAGLDALHGASAVLGYIALVATPLLAAETLARDGRASIARASVVVGCTSAALLAASFLGPASGLFQRTGLGVTDAWLCVAAIALLVTRSDRHVAGGRTNPDGRRDTGGTDGRLRLHDNV